MNFLHQLLQAAHLEHQQAQQPQHFAGGGGGGGGGGAYGAPQLAVGRGIPVSSVDGYYPQDNTAPMADPTDVGNFYQPAYQDPQASLNMGYQQNQGINNYRNPMPQNIQVNADPFGWINRKF